MKKNLTKHSLSKDFFLIFSVILVTIIFLSISFTWSVYDSKQSIRNASIYKQATIISREIESSFEYISHLMNILGKQIASEKPSDLSVIDQILKGKLITNEVFRQQFSWEMFDWSNPEGKIIVSTSSGILKKPIDVSYRNYSKMAENDPWVLHFDAADIGVTSGQWIIPAGMGITDEKGNLIGTLSLGINIPKFTRNLENSIDRDSTSFVILDDNYKITATSSGNTVEKIDRNYFISLKQELFGQTGYGLLSKAIDFNGIIYYSYIRVNGYPYTILVGYNKELAAKEFRETLLPGIIGYSIIGLVALILLFLIRKLLVSPIIRLSLIADQLSKGMEIKKIRGGTTYEINNLAFQLIKLKHFIKREHKTKQKQRELLKVIRDSDNEKEVFLRELYHAMNSPLNFIIACSEVMKARTFGNDMSSYDDYFAMLYSAGRQLESYTTDILNPGLVDIKEMITRCVTLQKKKASELRLTVDVDIQENIPSIMADELRIRQVIISTLGQSIFCIQDYGNIKIKVTAQKRRGGKPSKLIIRIEDNGLGVSEQERLLQWEKAFGNPDEIHIYSRNPDITRLSFPVIRHLIKLHHGEFTIKTISRVGTTFTIILPYLSKKELETNSTNFSRSSTNKESESIASPNNVIKFPG